MARLTAIAIDCEDPLQLGLFYRDALDLRITTASPELVALEGAGCALHFERVDNHRRPTWPDGATPKQLHLDITVADLDTEEARLIALGATMGRRQPDPEHWRVLIDPAGHPFCILLDRP